MSEDPITTPAVPVSAELDYSQLDPAQAPFTLHEFGDRYVPYLQADAQGSSWSPQERRINSDTWRGLASALNEAAERDPTIPPDRVVEDRIKKLANVGTTAAGEQAAILMGIWQTMGTGEGRASMRRAAEDFWIEMNAEASPKAGATTEPAAPAPRQSEAGQQGLDEDAIEAARKMVEEQFSPAVKPAAAESKETASLVEQVLKATKGEVIVHLDTPANMEFHFKSGGQKRTNHGLKTFGDGALRGHVDELPTHMYTPVNPNNNRILNERGQLEKSMVEAVSFIPAMEDKYENVTVKEKGFLGREKEKVERKKTGQQQRTMTDLEGNEEPAVYFDYAYKQVSQRAVR